MGTTQEPTISTEVPTDEPTGDSKVDFHRPLTSVLNGFFPHAFGREAKLFTEIRVLNRNVSSHLIIYAFYTYIHCGHKICFST